MRLELQIEKGGQYIVGSPFECIAGNLILERPQSVFHGVHKLDRLAGLRAF